MLSACSLTKKNSPSDDSIFPSKHYKRQFLKWFLFIAFFRLLLFLFHLIELCIVPSRCMCVVCVWVYCRRPIRLIFFFPLPPPISDVNRRYCRICLLCFLLLASVFQPSKHQQSRCIDIFILFSLSMLIQISIDTCSHVKVTMTERTIEFALTTQW